MPLPPPSVAKAPPAPPARGERLAVAALALAHAALFTGIAAVKYRWYLYDDFDLAIFSQATGGLLRGTLVSSIRGMPWLGDHQSLILFLLAPLYALARTPLTLLTVQSVALAAGAFPVWRFARRELAPGAPAVLCAALYLLYPALGYVDLFEFHPEALAVPLLLVALEGAWAGAARRTLVCAALALLTREDVALPVAGLALLLPLARRPRARLLAAALAGMAALVLALDFGVLRPLLGEGGQAAYGHMYAQWGATPREIVLHLLRAPWRAAADLFATPGDAVDSALKRTWWLQMLLPLAALPLAAPIALLPALPVLAEHMLSARTAQHVIVYQYTALMIPFALAAAVLGAGRIARGRPRAALAVTLAALAATLACQALFGPVASFGVLQGIERPEPVWPDDEARALRPVRDSLLARVPAHGGVLAGFEFLPRLAGRDSVHSMHHVLSGYYTYSPKAYPTPRGIVAALADVGEDGLLSYVDSTTVDRWHRLRERDGLRPVDEVDDLVLDLAGARDTVELLTPLPARPATAPLAVWGGALALDAVRAPAASLAAGRTLDFALDWRRAGSPAGMILTELLLIDDEGDVAIRRMRCLGYTRAPLARWPAGAAMRERYRLLVPADTPTGAYELRVRAWDAGPPWVRLPAEGAAVRDSDGTVRVGAFTVTAPR